MPSRVVVRGACACWYGSLGQRATVPRCPLPEVDVFFADLALELVLVNPLPLVVVLALAELTAAGQPGEAAPGETAQNLRILPRGTVDRLMGERRDILLLSDEPGDTSIYGGASTLVRSQALLRLHLKRDMPPGILAFGARTTSKFHPGQGTELLNFLGRAVEATLRGWLSRAN